MSIESDICICEFSHEFIPVRTRIPLKFGNETLHEVICVRVSVEVKNRHQRKARGWGETPLSVQWVWPSSVPYFERQQVLLDFVEKLLSRWTHFDQWGHCLEIGHLLIMGDLPSFLEEYNQKYRNDSEPLPWLAALVCASALDIALHDAYGMANGISVYKAYGAEYLNLDLASFLEPVEEMKVSFVDKFPADFLINHRPDRLLVWHLVGGLDPLDESELTGDEPEDGYPVHLRDWIQRDGLQCLKIKLRGNDAEWDYSRLVKVGRISLETGVDFLTTDFNCTVKDPKYVNEVLDRVAMEEKEIYNRILYVEQPFPYELEHNQIDVTSVAARKPLFMDESAHDWKQVRLGRELGWNGVALKTCKTQTGALLSLCWAKAHGMDLMVQDLTNPMLAQIPHVLLGAHAGTIKGVESNAMQFYPEASAREARVHPGIFQRVDGMLDLSSIRGSGFGYRIPELMA